MWRRPLTLSFLVHAAAGLAFWLLADRIPTGVGTSSPAIDTQVKEEEINIMVSAIGERAVVVPQVDPAPAEPAGRAGGVNPPSKPAVADSSLGGLTPPVRPAGTVFFQVATPARSVVYVIDCSGSMGTGRRLTLARNELLASLERLPGSARFQIIPYNRRAAPLRIDGRAELVPASQTNKETAIRLLEAVVPEGGTDHRPALEAALRLSPEAIYFLTDADDLPADLVRMLTQQNHGRTAIHTIELTAIHRNRLDMPLHLLARDNRGTYQWVDVK